MQRDLVPISFVLRPGEKHHACVRGSPPRRVCPREFRRMTADRRLTFCLTVGLDAMSLWLTSFKSNNASMISRGEFDVIGVKRVLDILDRYRIRSTFLVPGHTALCYPTLIQHIAERG